MANRKKKHGSAPVARARRDKGTQREVRYSRLHPPAGLEPEAWQIALRRQFGREQKFALENIGDHPVFSDFRVTNPAERRHLPRRDPRHRGWATTTAPVPTSPPTTSAPASTSSSPSHGSDGTRGGRAALRNGISAARSARSICTTARGAGAFPPRRPMSRRTACRRAPAVRRRRRLAAVRRSVSRGSTTSSREPRDGHELRVYDDVLAFVAELRDAERRRAAARRRRFPRGAKSAALEQAAEGAAAPLPARGRAVRRPRRPLPDRRRDGPGQDHPGHRRRRDHGPACSASSAC